MTSPTLATGHPLDLPRLLETRLLVQANSGGGKSWALRRILEQTAPQVQQLVIDPEGEFATLREKFDYIVCAAHDGDAVAHPRTAKLLARRLLETGVSAILDIYDLKRDEREAFVRNFCEALVDAPKKLWHPALIVLDEAHVYAPEKGSAKSSGPVIDLATRGRKRGFCLVAATQRLAKLHKDVAAELNNKMIGRTGLDVDVKRAADELGMTKQEATQALKFLDAGEWYVFGPALSRTVEKLTVGPVKTTHPKVGERLIAAPPEPSAKVRKALAELADLPQQAEQEARTLAELQDALAKAKAEIRRLERGAKRPPAAADPAELRELRSAVKQHETRIARLRGAVEDLMKFIVEINAKDFASKVGDVDPAAIEKAIAAAVGQATKLIETELQHRNREVAAIQTEGRRIVNRIARLVQTEEVTVAVNVKHNEPFTVAPDRPRREPVQTSARPVGTNGKLGKGEAKVLTAIAQHEEGVDREQVTVLTGYKRSTRDAYIQRLSGAGLVDVGPPIKATSEGIAALGPGFEPLPTGEELREYWLDRLPAGEKAVLEAVLGSYPTPVDRDTISDVTTYKRSTRDAYIQRLKARQLVTVSGAGVAASDKLF